MNFSKLILPVLFSLLSSQALASAMITVSGKLTSITNTEYVVETKNAKYLIKREAVARDESEKLSKKLETEVSIAVPMDAVKAVKSKQNE